MKIPSLSVIIPAYNEEKRLRRNLIHIIRYVKGNVSNSEIIVVDDGSTDSTPKILGEFKSRIKVLRNKQNRGKGYAVKRGFLESSKPWALFTDVDLSTPLEEMKNLWAYHGTNDVIFASRKATGAKIVSHQSGFRTFLGKGFPLLVQSIVLPGFLDTQCGFKLFNKQAVQSIFKCQTIDRWGFDVEILLIAKKKGLRIKEVPVKWTHSAESKLNPFKDSFKMFIELAKIKLNDWKGLYD